MQIAIPRLFWPLAIDATNDGVAFAVTGGAAAGTYAGAVAHATYLAPETLLAAVRTAMLAATSGGTAFSSRTGAACTVAASDDGLVTATLAVDGATQIVAKWNTGGTAAQALAALLGYDSTADDTDASAPFAFAADAQMQHFWTPGVAVEFDSGALSEYTRAVIETAGQQAVAVQNGAEFVVRSFKFSHVPPAKVLTALEGGAGTNQALQRFVGDIGAIARFRWWPDRTAASTWTDHYLREDSAKAWRPERMRDFGFGYHAYRFDLEFGAYNA